MSLKEDLQNHLSKFPTAPFLFVGSGMSRRYLGLEDWQGLLRRFAQLCNCDYEFFFSSASGDLPSVASKIAEEFQKIWWQDVAFANMRDKFKSIAKTPESALKIEIASYITDQSEKIFGEGELAQELECLRQVVIDGIVTTNWDILLEKLFPGFRVFIGQEQLLFSMPQGIGEIYKIHGCSSDPNSLVLTTNDYQQFRDRNPYLAAKLITMFIEHPVVFLGYSLTDKNILEILQSISSCLTSENIAKLQERLIFVQWAPNIETYEFTPAFIVPATEPIAVKSIKTSTFIPIYEALGATKRKFPAHLLRQLKEQVYELVLKSDPQNKLHVLDINDNTDISTLEVVFGVGTYGKLRESGYAPITRFDLFADVIHSGDEYDADKIVQQTLPHLLKPTQYVPVFKYLRRAGFLDDTGLIRRDSLDPRVEAAALASRSKFKTQEGSRKKKEEMRQISSFDDFVKSNRPLDVFNYACLLDEKILSPNNLVEFLIKNEKMVDNKSTYFAKFVCLYDFLAFGPQKNTERESHSCESLFDDIG